MNAVVVMLLCMVAVATAFKPSFPKVNMKLLSASSLSKQAEPVQRAMQIVTGATILLPQAAHADTTSAAGAVAIPLLISVLVMGPFLYYQQALKPKERTVKQIELDGDLKPIKDKSSGQTGVAKAMKKKK